MLNIIVLTFFIRTEEHIQLDTRGPQAIIKALHKSIGHSDNVNYSGYRSSFQK